MMFEKYDAYKDSELPSFGSVPIHWEIVPLCSITTLKSITNVVNEELLSVYLDKGVIRFDDVTEKRTNVTSLDLSKYQLVEEGDFVLNNQQAWRGSVGVSIYRGIVSPAYLVLKLSPKVDAKFANYFFRNSAKEICFSISFLSISTNLSEFFLVNTDFSASFSHADLLLCIWQLLQHPCLLVRIRLLQ